LKNKLLGTNILLFFLLFFVYNLQATNIRAGTVAQWTGAAIVDWKTQVQFQLQGK
jgi:hypothetical protein